MKALRQSFGKSVLPYVLLVAIPALGLVLLGLNSAARQRHALDDLINSNRQLTGERLADELERATFEAVDVCMHKASLVALDRPNSACWMAKEFFVVQHGTLARGPAGDPLAQRTARDLQHFSPLVPGKVYPLAYTTPGIGLGLAIVKHTMAGHGGRVEVDSEVGRGSRFRLIFPLA